MTLKAVSLGGDTAPCFPGFNSRRRLGESESDLSFTLRSGFRGDCYCPSSLRSPFPNWVSPPPTPHARGHPSSQPSLLSGGLPSGVCAALPGPPEPSPRTMSQTRDPPIASPAPGAREPAARDARLRGPGSRPLQDHGERGGGPFPRPDQPAGRTPSSTCCV